MSIHKDTRSVVWRPGSGFLLPALAWLCVVAAGGCERAEPPSAAATYSAPTPTHPGMLAPVTGSSPGSAADPHAGLGGASRLPPGHVPLEEKESPRAGQASDAAESAAESIVSKLARYRLELKIPAGWTEEPTTSAFRLATFRLARAEGDEEDAEVSITPALGTEDANIERWRAQFKEKSAPVLSKKEVADVRITLAEMEGTFLGAGAEKPGTRLWGAILRVSGVEHLVFIKAWGPRATMEKWASSFQELVGSAKKKE